MEANCLNCGNAVLEKYCGNCGQISSTHRYTLNHVIAHDFIHGVWHVDKGVVYTLKMLFTNPGNSVRAYILGKRANYFNFITLILLVLATSSLLGHYTHVKMSDLAPEASRHTVNVLEQFTTKYPKLVLLITIPVTSLFSLLWFRKAKFNYAEHLVMNAYKASAELIISLLFTVITIFYSNIKVLMPIYYVGIQGLVLLYGIWFYYHFFMRAGYSKKALFFRSLMVPASIIVLMFFIGLILGILGHVLHW